jgi:predicted Rossmann fold nucleotide-binding protein DprA/Smf involved in DNA uptake
MKLAIIGSRGFSDQRLMAAKLDPLLGRVSEVVSGGARGADSLGERWGKKNELPVKLFLPDHKQYRHPYHHRNRLIAEYCDNLVAFWDGRSTGTKYTIDYAKRIGKPVWVVKY